MRISERWWEGPRLLPEDDLLGFDAHECPRLGAEPAERDLKLHGVFVGWAKSGGQAEVQQLAGPHKRRQALHGEIGAGDGARGDDAAPARNRRDERCRAVLEPHERRLYDRRWDGLDELRLCAGKACRELSVPRRELVVVERRGGLCDGRPLVAPTLETHVDDAELSLERRRLGRLGGIDVRFELVATCVDGGVQGDASGVHVRSRCRGSDGKGFEGAGDGKGDVAHKCIRITYAGFFQCRTPGWRGTRGIRCARDKVGSGGDCGGHAWRRERRLCDRE